MPKSVFLSLPPKNVPWRPCGPAFAGWQAIGIENGRGGFLHFASTFLIPGFCQLCRLPPRGNDGDGLRAQKTPDAHPAITQGCLSFHSLIPFERASQLEFEHRPQFLPTNIAPTSSSQHWRTSPAG
jgi:hypothetical protein